MNTLHLGGGLVCHIGRLGVFLGQRLGLALQGQFRLAVIAIIVDKLGVDQAEVTPEASFTNDLGADSLDTVELIMEFEKEFNIAIPDDQAEKIQTVGQAVDYVEKNAK